MEIILAFDGDPAGQEAMMRASEKIIMETWLGVDEDQIYKRVNSFTNQCLLLSGRSPKNILMEQENRDEVLKKIQELVFEVSVEDPKWVAERRIEFLEAKKNFIQKHIDSWKETVAKYDGWFAESIKKNTVSKFEKLIQKLDKEIESYRNPKTVNYEEEINDEKIIEAKRVPIENFLQFNKVGFTKCLWHLEKTGSMKLYREANKFHCFGCNKSGDVIDIVMKLQSLDFIPAVKFLINKI